MKFARVKCNGLGKCCLHEQVDAGQSGSQATAGEQPRPLLYHIALNLNLNATPLSPSHFVTRFWAQQ